ncbi:MAG: hypothetical protein V4579_10595 [Pseudomonadota bacterium]
MNATVLDELSPARKKQLYRLAQHAADFAAATGISLEVVLAELQVLASNGKGAGGKRTCAGRKARHWPSVMGSRDEQGAVVGPDLFELEFALVVRSAVGPTPISRKRVFENWVAEVSVSNGAKKQPTWDAYQHALKQPPKGAQEAAEVQRVARRALSQLRCGINPYTGRAMARPWPEPDPD